jgi:hypothetical protein
MKRTPIPRSSDQMGRVVQFPKPDPERDQARLIREARVLYESVFPTEENVASVQPDPQAETR